MAVVKSGNRVNEFSFAKLRGCFAFLPDFPIQEECFDILIWAALSQTNIYELLHSA
jgi:hypothetical protein